MRPVTRPPLIGILGGMGPAATGEFLLELTRATPAEVDQDHFHTLIDCDCSIPDRTTAILNHDDGPLEPIRRGLFFLEEAGADILAVPCNTAHYFIDQFRDELSRPLVHIVDETIASAKSLCPEGAWITATTGTMNTQLYQRAAAEQSYVLHSPPADLQTEIMNTVGLVKANKLDEAGRSYRAIADQLFELRQLPLLTACTELPLAFNHSGLPTERAVSSLTALAQAVVREAQAWG
ncbi:amino acid racemase [Corynebacterium sp. H128]|uniref:aspartate/glutamate racemase family protein n=1 Tax=Corynebacterium sp. H128 TaxID=3133427 RepID=UPI0030A91B60